MTRRFTGWHMTAVMVAFFAVVIGVNFTMAAFAIDTFGGTVVDNSYVASQRYNAWLEDARRQQALGWKPTIGTDAQRHMVVSLAGADGRVEGARVSAVATHPLGALPPQALTFVERDGAYRSLAPLPAGRWLVRIGVIRGSSRASFDDEIAS